MQININRLIAPALCMIIIYLAGWTLLNITFLLVISAAVITVLRRKTMSTSIQSKYNDTPLSCETGLCFYIPIQGKTPLQTLTYNRKFISGTETLTSQKNSCA